MAVITKIEEQKNKKRVNIFVDDAFFCGMNKETAIVFKFKVGNEINEQLIKDAIFDSEVKSAIEKANDYLAVRMHSKHEIYDKLLKKSFEKSVIMKTLEKLEEYHYVDDELFAKQYVDQNKSYSTKMIENKLRQKGVSIEIINKELGLRDSEEELELCKKLIEKYAKSKDLRKEDSFQKMYSSFIRKGFSYDIIKRASRCVLKEDNDDFNFSD